MTLSLVSSPGAIRERPILFSGPMVRAILDGAKTQTRRVVKPQPALAPVHHFRPISIMTATGAWVFQSCGPSDGPVYAFRAGRDSVNAEILCPYGAPGDRLWVRETFDSEFNYPLDLEGEQVVPWHQVPVAWRVPGNLLRVYYRADSSAYEAVDLGDQGIDLVRIGAAVDDAHMIEGQRWAPSIFMPHWASRLTLQVTDVHVERLQEISEEDAIAEGVRPLTGELAGCYMASGDAMSGTTAVECYSRLWNSINAKRGLGWDANPWVWVVSFGVLGGAA